MDSDWDIASLSNQLAKSCWPNPNDVAYVKSIEDERKGPDPKVMLLQSSESINEDERKGGLSMVFLRSPSITAIVQKGFESKMAGDTKVLIACGTLFIVHCNAMVLLDCHH